MKKSIFLLIAISLVSVSFAGDTDFETLRFGLDEITPMAVMEAQTSFERANDNLVEGEETLEDLSLRGDYEPTSYVVSEVDPSTGETTRTLVHPEEGETAVAFLDN